MEIQPLETITRLGLFECDLSPDGQAVATIYREDEGFRLGVRFTTACRWLLDMPLAGPYARPRFDPEGRRVAAARQEEGVTVWSLPRGEEIFAQEREGAAGITAHAFGPGGQTLAIAQGNHLGVWNVDGAEWLWALALPAGIRALKSSPGGRLLGVGLQNGGAVVVDFEARDTVATLPDIAQPVTALAFHPAQPWLLAATAPSLTTAGGRPRRTGHGWAEVWNYRTGERVVRIPCDYQATLLGRGRYLATLTNNSRSLWIWQIPEADLVAHIENAVPELLIDEAGHEIRHATLSATTAGDMLAVAGLARPVSAVGVLRLFAFLSEAVPQP